MRHQFLASTGFSKQEYRGIRVRHAHHLFQHAEESRRAPDQALRRRPAARLTNDPHGFDEIGDFPLIVTDRRRLDIDMLFATRRMVQMQHALRRPGLEALLEGAGLPGLIARHVEMMRHLVAEAPGHRLPSRKLPQIGRIGGHNPVIGIHHDARLGQAVEKGKQLTEKMRSHVIAAIFVTIGRQF